MKTEINFTDVGHFHVEPLSILEEEPTFNEYTYDRIDGGVGDMYGVFAWLKGGGDDSIADFYDKADAKRLCTLLNSAL